MTSSWWFLWLIVMFLFLVPPLGYGLGYRGWGLPYPTYIQRRRGQRAVDMGAPAPFNHRAWGWAGDFVWTVLLIGIVCAVTLFWHR
jgi:hypothetical protein